MAEPLTPKAEGRVRPKLSWKSSILSRTKSAKDDEEKQLPPIAADVADKQQLELHRALFSGRDEKGLPFDFSIVYAQHVHAQIQLASTKVFEPLLKQFEKGDKFVLVDWSLSFVIAAISVSQALKEKYPSVDDIVKGIFTHYELPTALHPKCKELSRHAVFIILGWLTMLYQTADSPVDQVFEITAPENIPLARRRQRIDSAGRPFCRVLRNFADLLPMPSSPPVLPGYSVPVSADLIISTLNVYSITAVGKVTIVWTNVLSDHLRFDKMAKQLMLFRLPTFCAIAFCDTNVIFHTLLCHFGSSTESNLYPTRDFIFEVLLSYRLLFGQNKRARRLYRTVERSKASINKVVDPLLDTLCGEQKAHIHPEIDRTFYDPSVYDAKHDFPLLAPRLLELQGYVARQNPGSLLGLSKDRRNPVQFYTLFVVIAFGLVTIVLAIVQILLAVGQILLAAKQLNMI